MRANIRTGSLFLKDAHGKVIRLAWKNAGNDRDALRAVPPGRYSLVGYRMVRNDDAGTPWFLSATSPQGIRKIHLRPGRPQAIHLRPEVQVNCKGRKPGPKAKAKGTLAIQGGFQGEHRAGITLYRAGRRIPLAFQITDVEGLILERGAMSYG